MRKEIPPLQKPTMPTHSQGLGGEEPFNEKDLMNTSNDIKNTCCQTNLKKETQLEKSVCHKEHDHGQVARIVPHRTVYPPCDHLTHLRDIKVALTSWTKNGQKELIGKITNCIVRKLNGNNS